MNTKLKLLMAVVAVAACGRADNVGSRYVKSQSVQGGVSALISVSAAEEPLLAGTQLSIPAGALELDTNITLETGGLPLSSNPAGPIAVWGPPGLKFKTPARMTMPVTLPEGVVAEDLYIEVLEATGEQKTIEAVSLEGNLVSFEVGGFTAFQPSARSCTSSAQCSAGKTCVSGRCRRLTVDGGSQCAADADCAAGAVCQSGACQAALDGGAAPDAGSPLPDGGQQPPPLDAGPPDGGSSTPDGGPADGGATDGGTAPDGGLSDGGATDGGAPDSGTDGGAVDAGSAPDGGVADGGSSDGGAPDGGVKPSACFSDLDCAAFQRCVNSVCQ